MTIHKIIRKRIDAIDRNKELTSISVTDATKVLTLACDEVTAKAIHSCFKKAGFLMILMIHFPL